MSGCGSSHPVRRSTKSKFPTNNLAGQGRAGQGRAGQGRAGQGRAAGRAGLTVLSGRGASVGASSAHANGQRRSRQFRVSGLGFRV